jgi:hypothetical protein
MRVRKEDAMEPEEREARTEEQIKVRQVTSVQASWTELERAAPGAFTIQLILDHGAEEYVIRPAPEDVEALLRLLEQSGGAMFDLERKVLMFSNVTLAL